MLQVLKDFGKDWVEMTWHNGIKKVADLIITGNVLYAEQGLGIIASLTLMEPTLVLQKRRGLREKDAKGP